MFYVNMHNEVGFDVIIEEYDLWETAFDIGTSVDLQSPFLLNYSY